MDGQLRVELADLRGYADQVGRAGEACASLADYVTTFVPDGDFGRILSLITPDYEQLRIAVDAFAWNWIWIVPPILAILLNLKHARKIPGRTRADLVIAGTLVLVEIYCIFRLMAWFASWMTPSARCCKSCETP